MSQTDVVRITEYPFKDNDDGMMCTATGTGEWMWRLHSLARYIGRDCHIFAHWWCSLCSKKCAQLVFSCFWLQTCKIDVCWNLKKVVNSLIHQVSAYNSHISWSKSTFFVKCPAMWKNWALYTQNANTRSQFWVQILC